jgi:hypothetical protein
MRKVGVPEFTLNDGTKLPAVGLGWVIDILFIDKIFYSVLLHLGVGWESLVEDSVSTICLKKP